MDKNNALRSMTDTLAAEMDWSVLRADHFYAGLLACEKLGSTGIGNGFAVPHATVDWSSRCVTAIALVPDGIDFDALDGMPVHTLVMLVAPRTKPGDYLRLLERISRSIQFIGPHPA
jgi:mannitol/fructose-specific phosphotransferase system IIA component (Ntr-type)